MPAAHRRLRFRRSCYGRLSRALPPGTLVGALLSCLAHCHERRPGREAGGSWWLDNRRLPSGPLVATSTMAGRNRGYRQQKVRHEGRDGKPGYGQLEQLAQLGQLWVQLWACPRSCFLSHAGARDVLHLMSFVVGHASLQAKALAPAGQRHAEDGALPWCRVVHARVVTGAARCDCTYVACSLSISRLAPPLGQHHSTAPRHYLVPVGCCPAGLPPVLRTELVLRG